MIKKENCIFQKINVLFVKWLKYLTLTINGIE